MNKISYFEPLSLKTGGGRERKKEKKKIREREREKKNKATQFNSYTGTIS